MKSQIPYRELQVSIKNHVTIEIMPGFAEFHNNRKYFFVTRGTVSSALSHK